jgi:hypothetical protein
MFPLKNTPLDKYSPKGYFISTFQNIATSFLAYS